MQVSELEGRVRMLENELREHGKQSAIMPDGTVNVNHTRKKKRLDQEIERAIDRVASQRERLNALQQRYEHVSTLLSSAPLSLSFRALVRLLPIAEWMSWTKNAKRRRSRCVTLKEPWWACWWSNSAS
mgnify:CR=1 FL=1